MTGESKANTEPWVKESGATYPYAYDPGNRLFSSLRMESRPSAVLVDPSGTIVYKGHPNSITPDVIEKALSGALTTPVWEWPKEASKVVKHLGKGAYARALAEAEALAQDGLDGADTFVDAVRNLIAGKAKAITGTYERGDYLGAQELARRFRKNLKGLPEEDVVKSTLKNLASGDAKKVIKAQKSIRKIVAEPPRRKKHALEAIKALEKVAKKAAGTYAETEAKEHIARLEAMAQKMR